MAKAESGRARRVRQRVGVIQVDTPSGKVRVGGRTLGTFEANLRSLLTEFRDTLAQFPAGGVVFDVDASEPARVDRAAIERFDNQFHANLGRLLAAPVTPVELVRLEATPTDPTACRVTARFDPAPLDTPAVPVQGEAGAGRPDGVTDGEQETQDSWQAREERRRGVTGPIDLAAIERAEAVVARLRQEGVDRINELLAELAEREGGSPADNKQIADRLNKLAKSIGAVLLADGQPARVSWTGAVFMAAAAAKVPSHIRSGKALMALKVSLPDASSPHER